MNFRIILFSIVFLCNPFAVSAQSDTIYISKKLNGSCSKALADSYLKVRLVDSLTQRYACEYYALDGTLKARGYYRDNTLSHITGTYTEFYKNGKRKLNGSYFSDGKEIIGEQFNTWFYWYENGSIQLEKHFLWDTISNSFLPYLINFWDTAGVKRVTDGNGDYTYKEQYWLSVDSSIEITLSGSIKSGLKDGVWKGVSADGTVYSEETYSQENLSEGKGSDRNGTSYVSHKVETGPYFIGGDSALISFLQKNTRYPLGGIMQGEQGRVMVKFVVDKTGKVKDAKITRSVSHFFDKEALRVVNLLPDFKPGTIGGKPVDVYFNLPIVFKLQ